MYCYNYIMNPRKFEHDMGFSLDSFQRDAIDKLHGGRSVLVVAPTGSGKTVVAEYGLEAALSAGKKFFYTTPLKALSNQKFRDFQKAYSPRDVGLLTGDNSINAGAPLVVMTTEVLRNMIYEKSPLLEALGAAALDECHYLHDPFRGAVWEEIIINLPVSVKLIALSATISNAAEFGDWMDSLRGDVDLVIHTQRPVKLKNYYFIGGALMPLFSKNLFRVIDQQLDMIKREPRAMRGQRGRRKVDLRPRREDVIEELDKREMLPAIYFLFSRAACMDSVIRWLESGGRLTSPEEAEQVVDYLDEKASSLSLEDLECLDYKRVRAAMAAGVAAHHAGALPLFKEAVEELFAAGLIKVVFATETLSLGINMPARSVVIESLSKWGGDKQRPVTPGEYKQLTGRAGRRGIDEIGHAVVLYQGFFSPDHVRSLVSREPSPVVSSFEVSYNMAVNVLATRNMTEAQKLINLSFAQYAADRKVVSCEARIESMGEDIEKMRQASQCDQGGDAGEYRELEKNLSGLSRKLSTMEKERRRRETRNVMAKLQPGDVFTLGHRESGRTVAVVKKSRGGRGERGVLVVDSSGRYRKLWTRSVSSPPRVLGSVNVDKLTSPTRKVRRSVGARMEMMGQDINSGKTSRGGSAEERELAVAVAAVRESLEKKMCNECRHRQRCLESARRLEKVKRRMRLLEKERDSGRDLVSRRLIDVVAILNSLGFMEGEGLTRKGEVLRRVYNECDLLLVESLERGFVSRLDPRELVVFASWFIYESREGEGGRDRGSQGEPGLEQNALGEAEEWLENFEEEIRKAEEEKGLDIIGSIDTGFTDAAYTWAGGADLSEMLERFRGQSVGDMVRTMKQIIDLLRQIHDVSEDPVLRQNLGKAMAMVDRGVVGYSSLESIIEHTG